MNEWICCCCRRFFFSSFVWAYDMTRSTYSPLGNSTTICWITWALNSAITRYALNRSRPKRRMEHNTSVRCAINSVFVLLIDRMMYHVVLLCYTVYTLLVLSCLPLAFVIDSKMRRNTLAGGRAKTEKLQTMSRAELAHIISLSSDTINVFSNFPLVWAAR